jgi:glycosyltransferase involved in cell wall biosynthesis
MRVLRTYFSVPPSPGGMEQHVHELSVHQRRQGVEVVQAFSRGALEAEHGFQVLRGWPILRIRPRALRDLLFYSAVLIGVRRRNIRVDVVHIHGDWSAFLFGRILKSVTHARLLVGSVHGHVPESRWRRAIFKRCVACYQVLYATGVRECDLLARWSNRKWSWIASGISECFFEAIAASKTTDVVVVGSLVPVKGLDLAVEIARRTPQRKFRIIGDGPERSRLEALASQGRVENLRFQGRLEPAAVAAELAQSRVLLLTSLKEGTPTAMLEAMAAGLPVVTTSSNDYSALLGAGEGGVIVESRDPQELSRAVERWAADESLAGKAGERNRVVAGGYAWPAVAQRITREMAMALSQP